MATADEQWRQDITRRVEELGAQNQTTAIILERIQNTQANHAADIAELRKAPDSWRDNIASATQIISLLFTAGGCLLSPVMAGMISLAVGIAIWLITTH
jgi:hypothetical protein